MKVEIIDKKNIKVNDKAYVLTNTLSTEEILTALRRGVLSTTAGDILSEDTLEVNWKTATTFELNGAKYTLKKGRTEKQLLRDLDNRGFVKLNNNIYLNSAGSSGNTNIDANSVIRKKDYQTEFVETAGTGRGTGGDTGIATSNTATDLLSFFFGGNYKDYFLKNRDKLEIAFLLGDRRSFIQPRRREWTPFFSMNDLLNQTLILPEVLNIQYNFNATIDANLNITVSDNHTGQANLFGATFSVILRYKL